MSSTTKAGKSRLNRDNNAKIVAEVKFWRRKRHKWPNNFYNSIKQKKKNTMNSRQNVKSEREQDSERWLRRKFWRGRYEWSNNLIQHKRGRTHWTLDKLSVLKRMRTLATVAAVKILKMRKIQWSNNLHNTAQKKNTVYRTKNMNSEEEEDSEHWL